MVNTHSCRYCKKLKVKFPAPKAGRYINKVVLKRIKSAASNGCGFFEWCLSQWKTYLHTLEDTSVLEIWAFMEADDRPGQLRMQWQSDSDIPDIDKMVFMNLVALDSSLAAQSYPARPISLEVNSSGNFDMAKDWLAECKEEHISCRDEISLKRGDYPQRMVSIMWDLGSPEPTIKLVDYEKGFSYAALSYCWGAPCPVDALSKLSSKNYTTWKENISFSILPETLQDAVITAWKLGIAYIWIDRVCIMQDDKKDKIVEIAKMPQIYQGAELTLSAARAASSGDGFLHRIEYPSMDSTVFQLSYFISEVQTGTVLAVKMGDHNQEGLEVEPIHRRGWTLEEYLLSPRILIYGSYGVQFNCRQNERHPGNDEAVLSPVTGSSISTAVLRDILDSASIQGIGSQAWGRFLVEYTSRTLTQLSDRLIAISGIASLFSHYREADDVYLAGLWKNDLPAALLWQSKSPLEPKPQAQNGNDPPPSWSWAKINTSCVYDRKKHTADPHFKLLSYKIEVAEPLAVFGDVKYCRLRVSGMMKSVIYREGARYNLSSASKKHEGYVFRNIGAGPDYAECEGDQSHNLWCLQINAFLKTQEPMDSVTGGLLLEKIGEDFSRIGMFFWYDTGVLDLTSLVLEIEIWEEDYELQEITII